jgi:hypothetical protein
MMTRELRKVLVGFEWGEFRAVVDAKVPFAEATGAHRRIRDRENFGKGVLIP